ncbi:unnamed protein product [Polarella glacialis]|uniref:Uncharacterized protein n=1 Tax=Polarella glacialis TaxID=89957 RepID=A0A813GAH9_POLGL|nr:unnamed protein product [Polarella glacialis]
MAHVAILFAFPAKQWCVADFQHVYHASLWLFPCRRCDRRLGSAWFECVGRKKNFCVSCQAGVFQFLPSYFAPRSFGRFCFSFGLPGVLASAYCAQCVSVCV